MAKTAEIEQTRRIALGDVDLLSLFGPYDAERKALEEIYGVSLVSRDGSVAIAGPPEALDAAEADVNHRLASLRDGVEPEDIPRHATSVSQILPTPMPPRSGAAIVTTAAKKTIAAKSRGQKAYIEAVWEHDIVFAIGPAGTGKTYLAVAMAVAAMRARAITRIVLARPAVEAGEHLGFLPGDLQDKVDPYLRPLYDALYEIVSPEKLRRHFDARTVEVVPLAFMCGRTLNDAFVILDEAQNTTPKQMKMFLTRLGGGSKAIIAGDATQVDLPDSQPSGLAHARTVLEGAKGIASVALTERDVVRHRLVQSIVKAYDKFEAADEPDTDGAVV